MLYLITREVTLKKHEGVADRIPFINEAALKKQNLHSFNISLSEKGDSDLNIFIFAATDLAHCRYFHDGKFSQRVVYTLEEIYPFSMVTHMKRQNITYVPSEAKDEIVSVKSVCYSLDSSGELWLAFGHMEYFWVPLRLHTDGIPKSKIKCATNGTVSVFPIFCDDDKCSFNRL